MKTRTPIAGIPPEEFIVVISSLHLSWVVFLEPVRLTELVMTASPVTHTADQKSHHEDDYQERYKVHGLTSFYSFILLASG